MEFDLLAANTEFQKKKGKIWTFMDRATNTCRQLDYILVRKKWRNSVQNAEAYNSFNTVKSDHRVVTVNICLSLRVPKAKVRVWYDWQHFSTDTDMQQRYTLAVRNRFEVLGEETNEELYTKFNKANEEAMEECVPKRQRTKKLLQANHPDIVTARNRVHTTHTKYSQSETPEDKREWKQAIECLYNTYDRLKEEELLKKIDRIEQANGDHKHGEAWKVVNEMTGRKKAKEG